MQIYTCPLARLEATADAVRPNRIVSLIRPDEGGERPRIVSPECQLQIGFHDIPEPRAGYIAPQMEHVERLMAFARAWDQSAPLLIHCFAGISRSTASAYVVACALRPELDEAFIADRLRAASPSATPNARIIALGDVFLQRKGKMQAAIAAIGRGREAFEGEVSCLALT